MIIYTRIIVFYRDKPVDLEEIPRLKMSMGAVAVQSMGEEDLCQV